MTELPYWGIAATLVWICTRDLSYIQMLQTGDAGWYEKPTALDISLVLAKFQQNEKRPNVMSIEQAKAELLAKLRTGELKARGVKCDPFNKGNAISDTAQDIPATDWMDLRLDSCPPNSGGHSDGRYAAFFEHNHYPSWRRVRYLSATAQQLWPQDQTETTEAAQTSQPVPAPARKRPVSQQSVAEEVGREIFPYGVPASMTTQQISAAIAEGLKIDHPHVAKVIKPKTLGRAASRLPKSKLDN